MTQHPHWRRADAQQASEAEKYARPIPSREYLLEVLRESGAPQTADSLAETLKLKDKGLRAALEKRLAAMARDGQLLRNRRNEFLLLDRLQVRTGQVTGHRDGFGFFVPDDGSDDAFLPPAQMRAVMHGDRVAVRIVGVDARNRKEGAVVEVLERRTRQVAGRFHLEHGVGFVAPDNRRISQRVVIPARDRNGAANGSLVVAEIVQPPSGAALAVGRIARVLPEEGVAQTAIELAVASHQLPHEFPAAVLREARRYGKSVEPKGLGARIDLRGVPLVTIDGEDARDFDDAVYAEPTKGGWRLLVAIADVSHYVRPGTALDTEARERATSVYFPGRVIPMLPEQLSNHLCSLMPEVDRACLVAELAVGRDGRVTRARFFAALMRSAARLTYTRAAEALVERKPEVRATLPKPVLDSLESLHDLYRALRRYREVRGALDFEAAEVKVIVGADGRVADLRAYPRNDAHRLIEECMIAANVEAARFLKKHRMPALYRVHAQPDEERILELKRFLATRGLLLETEGEIDPLKLARLLRQVQGRPDAAMLEGMIIRSLAQAVYQPENIGHFGLALEAYAHFTSPIRRYPDLLVHRAIRHVLAEGAPEAFEHPAREMEQLGQECSLRERRADEASRDVVAFLKCEYMRDRLGETFAGAVTGVTDFGLFVQLDGLQVDGLVHVATLGRDYFRFEEDRRALVGERSGERYTLGDKLTVRVARVDPSERKIDFELVGKSEAAFHPRRRAGAAEPRPEAARPRPGAKRDGRPPKGAAGGRGRKGGRGR
ncbi:MAG TPA: ribonuclease R [Steroidobacteraceae bacterium]|nr:ribonuclease R [Steroidobacteraceae bacterium]